MSKYSKTEDWLKMKDIGQARRVCKWLHDQYILRGKIIRFLTFTNSITFSLLIWSVL